MHLKRSIFYVHSIFLYAELLLRAMKLKIWKVGFHLDFKYGLVTSIGIKITFFLHFLIAFHSNMKFAFTLL